VGRDPVTGRPRQVFRIVEAANKTAANRALAVFIAEVGDQATPDSSATVAVVLEEWLRHSEAQGRAPKTLYEARKIIDNDLVPVLGDIPTRDLTPRHIDELYRRLSTGEGRAKPLKPASVRRYHAVLSAALAQAVRWGWLERNPAERATPPALDPEPLRIPTTDEVKQLLSAAPERDERVGDARGPGAGHRSPPG
jgi:hypothetical protein